MAHTNTLPPLGSNSKILAKLRPDAPAPGLPGAPGAITGHDLMAMFPPVSPQTVRMRGGASCTVFAQQERAFLSHPHPAKPPSSHPTPSSAQASEPAGAQAKRGDAPADRPRSETSKVNGARDGARASRKRAPSNAAVVGEVVLHASAGGEGAKASVTAIHARRLDKQTGLTFIETKYKEDNVPAFIFVNHVV